MPTSETTVVMGRIARPERPVPGSGHGLGQRAIGDVAGEVPEGPEPDGEVLEVRMRKALHGAAHRTSRREEGRVMRTRGTVPIRKSGGIMSAERCKFVLRSATRRHTVSAMPVDPPARPPAPLPPSRRSLARSALLLDDEALEAQCELSFFVASGPGGQHRNKTESGVRLTHRPTELSVTATERRSQLAEPRRGPGAPPRGTARLDRGGEGPPRHQADQGLAAAPSGGEEEAVGEEGAAPRRLVSGSPGRARHPGFGLATEARVRFDAQRSLRERP